MDKPIKHPSLLRRFMIILYDSLLIAAVSMAYGILYMAIAKWLFQVDNDRAEGLLFQLGWLFSVVGFFCYFWIKGGQTTGMRAWKTKIVNEQNTRPSVGQCLLRILLAPIGWLLFFSSFFDSQQRCLHDIGSKTQLILLDKN